jgi:hypothetical protein
MTERVPEPDPPPSFVTDRHIDRMILPILLFVSAISLGVAFFLS